jgi:hypothetical protein
LLLRNHDYYAAAAGAAAARLRLAALHMHDIQRHSGEARACDAIS